MFYLHMRSALIETAAAFDRIQQAEDAESVWEGAQMEKLRLAANELLSADPDRTRRILEAFSVTEDDA